MYRIQKSDILGSVREPEENYDLLTVIMIGLDTPEAIGKSGTSCGLLSLFLSPSKLTNMQRKELIQNEYQYTFLHGEEETMENITDIPTIYYEAGIEQGVEQGAERGRIESQLTT